MQFALGGSLHKNITSYLLLGLYHASVNRISIVLMQITPQDERYCGICARSELADLYHVIMGCDKTISLTLLSWYDSRGLNSTHQCHYTIVVSM